MPKSNSLVSKLISDPKFASCDMTTSPMSSRRLKNTRRSSRHRISRRSILTTYGALQVEMRELYYDEAKHGTYPNSSGSRFRPWKRKLNEWEAVARTTSSRHPRLSQLVLLGARHLAPRNVHDQARCEVKTGSMLSTRTYSASLECAPKPCNPNRSTTAFFVSRPAKAASVPPPSATASADKVLAKLPVDCLGVLARDFDAG